MIVYNKLWELLKSKGIPKYKFRYEFQIGGGTYQRLNKNEPVSTATLDYICNSLHCRLEDIAEHIEDTN